MGEKLELLSVFRKSSAEIRRVVDKLGPVKRGTVFVPGTGGRDESSGASKNENKKKKTDFSGVCVGGGGSPRCLTPSRNIPCAGSVLFDMGAGRSGENGGKKKPQKILFRFRRRHAPGDTFTPYIFYTRRSDKRR